MSKKQQDTSYDIFRYDRHPLDAIFKPQSIAVIGATERKGSVGRTILANLISSPFGGTVYPVNLKRPAVLGVKAYPNLTAIGAPVELAVIVVPAKYVPAIVQECVDHGVRGAIIISAGFKETGAEGVALEKEVMRIARAGNLRIVGPNCLGVMNPTTGMNATFASTIAQSGSVGFISQSGALCSSVLDWSFRQNVGFSAFVSIGSMLDVDWGDLIYYLGDDPNTRSIVIYMETVGDARSFMSAAREVALTKPIIIIKPGRTEAAAQAAASHTGSLTGSDEVLRAAFRRVGVLRVENISDLFDMSEVLAKQPLPKGKRLTIITNAGGPGVLATDSLIAGGGELGGLSAETRAGLDEILPAHWSHHNPIDILGDASPERYRQSLAVAAKDPNSDGLLVILSPQAMTDPTETAHELAKVTAKIKKPVLASWMGGSEIRDGEAVLNEANIPTFEFPDTATEMFNYLWRYRRRLDSLYETPVLDEDEDEGVSGKNEVKRMIEAAKNAGRTILTEYESKQIFNAYDIPTVETHVATTVADAIEIADTIGYPAVLKLHSHTITHKTDAKGVQLNLADADAVRNAFATIQNGAEKYVAEHHAAPATGDFLGVTVQPMLKLDGYELIVGSSPDPQFGPVLLFGTGGTLVEVFKDRELALPPLNSTLARRMMERTKIYHALHGIRGRDPIDIAELEQVLVRFSQLVVEQTWIKEIDINPLLASPEHIIALDARVVLYDADTKLEDVPRLAIRPYPTRYSQPWLLRDGTPVNIRPIRPEDEPMIADFHAGLSSESVYMRYFASLDLDTRTAHDRLTRICFIDYDREMALVITRKNAKTDEREIIAVGRMTKARGKDEAEFALLIRDDHQRQGIGTVLLERLLVWAKDEGVGCVVAYILPTNAGMKRICQKLGFSFSFEDGIIKAEIKLV